MYESININVFDQTLINQQFQWSNEDMIIIGAGQEGGSAITISNYFENGTCGKNDTFFNQDPLTNPKSFRIKRFEVWGFDLL